MATSGYILKYAAYLALGAIADVLDMVLSCLAPGFTPERISDAEDLEFDDSTYDQLLQLLRTPYERISNGVVRINPSTVLKVTMDSLDDGLTKPSGALAHQLVYEQTSIPVPRIRRSFTEKGDDYIIMDFIEGTSLDKLWPGFSLWKKCWVAFTLRRYIKQLRRMKLPSTTPPGPLGEAPRECYSPIFCDRLLGPFASKEKLSWYLNRKYQIALDYYKVPENDPFRKDVLKDSEYSLVLTHQDLNPRNIILGEDGRLWIIDWDWSGYYPEWFESMTMSLQADNEMQVGFNGAFWNLMIPFVCGPFFKRERWQGTTGMGLYLYTAEDRE